MSGRVFMGRRMQQPADQTQDRTHILQEERAGMMKMKGKFVREVIDISDSEDSSSDDEDMISKQKDFSCTSCSRTFSCQQALAGHRNSHRSEWEALLDEPDDDCKTEHPKIPIHSELLSPFHTPKVVLKQPLGYTSSNVSDASSTSHKVLLGAAPQYPLAKTTNILKGQSARAPRYPFVYPTNIPKQPSTSLERRPSVNPINTLIQPSPRYGLADPPNTLKGRSPRYPLSPSRNYLKYPLAGQSLACPTNNLKRLSLSLLANQTHNLKEASSGHPLENPTNPLDAPSVPATQYSFATTANTFIGSSSFGAPNHRFTELKNTPHKSSLQDPIHPSYNLAKEHSKSALHVRRESSMIHKSCQCRQLGHIDMLLRTKSTLLDMKQMMEGNLRHLGTSKRIVDLISHLLDGSFDSSSRYETGGSSTSRSPDLLPYSFHPGGGKAVMVHDLFPLTPTQERHIHDNDPSSIVQGKKPDNNGGEADLDLKL